MAVTAKDIFEAFRKAAVEVLVPEIRETNARIDVLRERMDERFEKMDERFERMDERFVKMNERLGNVELGLANLRSDVREMGASLRALAQVIEAKFDAQEKIDRRLMRVEEQVGELWRKAG